MLLPLLFAVLSSFLAPVSAQQVALTPLPDERPASEDAKQATESSFSNVLARFNDESNPDDRAVRKAVLDLEQVIHNIERQERQELQRRQEFFRSHPVSGVPFDELKHRLEFIFNVHMLVTYGNLAPQAFNEGFEQASHIVSFPKYPLPLFISLSDYCEKYTRYGREIDDLIRGIDFHFIGPVMQPTLCEQTPDIQWPSKP